MNRGVCRSMANPRARPSPWCSSLAPTTCISSSSTAPSTMPIPGPGTWASGGRKDPEDPDVLNTVLREVHEEVGIDLRRQARLIGPIDEVQGVARGRQLPLVISPFVFVLETAVEPRPNHEVQSVLWVPLSYLAEPSNESIVEYSINGQQMRLPAYIYQDRTIWGLTFRMIRGFLEVVSRQQRG